MAEAAPVNEVPAQTNARLARRFAWAFGVAAVVLVILVAMMGTEWRDAVKTVTAKGRALRAIHYGQWGVWWGCAVVAVLCAGLALTSRWWAAGAAARRVAAPEIVRMTRGAWIGLFVILMGAGAIRWERAGLSFYNDEAQAFRRYIGGQHLRQDDGTVKWHRPPWWETTWLNKSANNSMPFSILGRLSFDAWGRLTGAAPGEVNERAVRLPVFLAAMAGLVALWAVMRRMLPGTGACWWALALGALHPWHVRYSSEARGHGFLLLGVPLCFWFLQRALEDDRWRWWLGMGVAQFFCVWGFQGCAPFLVVFNGFLLAWMMWQAWRGEGSWQRLPRPLLGMTVGGMITLPVMLPLMEQLAEAIQKLKSLKGTMGLEWWQDVLSFLLAGFAWVDLDQANPRNLALSRVAAQHPWIWVLVFCALFALAWGTRRLWRCGLPGWLAVMAAPLAVAGMWWVLSRKGTYLYPWYLIFMLPGLLMVWAGGVAASTLRARGVVARGAAWAVALLPMAGMAWVDWHIATVPKEDLRGLAQAVPNGALHGALFSDVDVYDGRMVTLIYPTKLDGLIAEARATARPLYVSFSRRSPEERFMTFYRRIEEGGEFEHVADFPGQQDPQFLHHLYRLRE